MVWMWSDGVGAWLVVGMMVAWVGMGSGCQGESGVDGWMFVGERDAGGVAQPDVQGMDDAGMRDADAGESVEWVKLEGLSVGEVGFELEDRLWARVEAGAAESGSYRWFSSGGAPESAVWDEAPADSLIDGTVADVSVAEMRQIDVAAVERVSGAVEIRRSPVGGEGFGRRVWPQFDRDVQVEAGVSGELLVRSEGELWEGDPSSGEFEEITPEQARIGVSDVGAYPSSTYVRVASSGDILARLSGGQQEWQRDSVASREALGPSEWGEVRSVVRGLGPSEENEAGEGWTVQLPSSFFGVFTEIEIQSPVALRRETLVAVDEQMYALGTAGRILRIDSQQGAQMVVDQPVPAGRVVDDVMSFDGRVYANSESGGESVVLSWAPGEAQWRLESVSAADEAVADELVATEEGIWVNAGAVRQWVEQREAWEVPRSGIGDVRGLLAAGDAVFAVGSSGCVYRVADEVEGAWSYVAEWNVAEGPVGAGCDETGMLGEFTSVAGYREGYVFGHRAGQVGGMPAADEGGVGYWSEESGTVRRVGMASLPADAPSVVDVTAMGETLWVMSTAASGERAGLHRKVGDSRSEEVAYEIVGRGGEVLGPGESELRRVRAVGNALFGVVGMTVDGAEEERLAVWRSDEGVFEIVEPIQVVSDVYLTSVGPVVVEGGDVLMWEASGGWRVVGEVPGDGDVVEVGAREGDVVVGMESGGVWVGEMP